MTSLESLLALNLLPGIGPIRVRRLIKQFGGLGEYYAPTPIGLLLLLELELNAPV